MDKLSTPQEYYNRRRRRRRRRGSTAGIFSVLNS